MTPALLALLESAGHGIADACDVVRPIAQGAVGFAADLLELVAERLREVERGLSGHCRGARPEVSVSAGKQGIGGAHGEELGASAGIRVVENRPVWRVETPEDAARMFGGSLDGWREVYRCLCADDGPPFHLPRRGGPDA